jgi:hypothetical protein
MSLIGHVRCYLKHFAHMAKISQSTIMHVQYCVSYNSQIKCFNAHADMDIFLLFVCGTHAQNLSAPFRYTLYICNT